MARMSIDDMMLRDPRVLRLARAAGWSRFEVVGRLIHVYAVVYDRVDAGSDDIVQGADIDMAGELEGLAALMIEHGLAEETRRGVRIRGAKERTNYLATRKTTGQLGGIKSGESRRNKAKQTTKVTFNETEGRANPTPTPTSVPVVDPVPVPVAVVAPRPQIAAKPLLELKIKAVKAPKVRRPHPLPSDWEPRVEEGQSADASGLNCKAEADSFRDHHTAKGSRFEDWHAAFRNWLRNAVKFGGGKSIAGKQTGRVEPKAPNEYPEGEISL